MSSAESTLNTTEGTPLQSKNSLNLWVERGFSRREIAARMQSAVPTLNIFSSPIQPIEGTPTIALPSPRTTEDISLIDALAEENSIDALWLQDSAKYDLSGLETPVHVAANPDTIRLVDDKIAFMEWLGDDKYRPFSAEAVGVEAIYKEYQRRQSNGHEVCIKPVIGVNGQGYWRLSEQLGGSLLNNPEHRVMNPDVYLSALDKLEDESGPQRMILMDYLPGPEVSVDLLTWRGTPLIHAARTKIDRSTQRIQSEHEVLEHSHSLASRLGFHGIISLQYRLDDNGDWKILEINPRPAGGSTHSEDAEFGIISNWAQLVTGNIDPSSIKQHQDDVTLSKKYDWNIQRNK